MPRIDPERLLKTLAPLLEPASGAIKSDKEVDKIYGLMSKFSKKLVSKCTYINILRASSPEVLDLFLQRGGWDMVLGWTLDATTKKNYELLKQISALLLYAPATVQRLKENELPKIVKSLSKDCENEEIRELAKQVVMKWISIAKQQDCSVGSKLLNANPVINSNQILVVPTIPVTANTPMGTIGGESDVTSTHTEFDISSFDITQAHLNEMIDFNPEVFAKVVDNVDQHLGDVSAETVSSSTTTIVIDSTNSTNHVVSSSTVSSSSSEMSLPNSPKLLIKTAGGQKALVRSLDTNEPTKQDDSPFCIMMKDGKPFLIRLKLASPQEVSQLKTTTVQEIQSTELSAEKPRRPRKDPTISTMRKVPDDGDKQSSSMLKTYSKKHPLESESTKESAQTSDTSSKAKLPKSSETRKPKSGSSSKSISAAKRQAEEEKLREKIKQEKIMLKKRAKEAAKQKQVEKDQETLRKLNLTSEPSVVNTSPGSNKIPKIPKKQSSFSDAIGIPGASDSAISTSEKALRKKASTEDLAGSNDSSPSKGRKESPSNEGRERRHRVKVFTSKKSRSDDLLKDMTETVKSNKSNKSESGKATESMLVGGDKAVVGSNLISKSEKRPSIDGMEKPGDTKKQKLSDDQSDKKKETKDSKSGSNSKDRRPVKVIQESSLFMDALTAETPSKVVSKRKRRLSSTTDKDVIAINKGGRNNSVSKDKLSSPSEETVRDAVKPVFNFYQETLDYSETTSEKTPRKSSPREEEQMDISEDPFMNNSPDVSFIPTEDELKLKSSLVILRPKNKPKKTVRWREEEELKEVFFFELDEDERVNVAKQKDFSAMKEHEKAEEKEFAQSLKRRILGTDTDDSEEKMPWRKPALLLLTQQFPSIVSEEKVTQEERERLNLGVFLPPGSVLPETPAEPDPESPTFEDIRVECRMIPMEDVTNVTKVFDKRINNWPKAEGLPMNFRIAQPIHSPNQPPFGAPHFGMPGVGDSNVQPPANTGFHNGQNNLDYNPWTGVTAPRVPNIGDTIGFPSMMGAMNMPPPGPPPMGFPPGMNNSFGFTVPPPGLPLGFPPPGINFPVNSGPMLPNHVGRDANRGHSAHNANRGRGSGRDYGDRDMRNQYRDSRDQDLRQKDGYDNRGRSRGDYRSRDRDKRSPSPTRRRRDDRERDRYGRDDKDYRDHDYRSRARSGGKAPCRYFRKGHCNNGSRCEFSHCEAGGDVGAPKHDSSRVSAKPIVVDDTEDWEAEDSSRTSAQLERRISRDGSESGTNFSDAPSSPANEISEDPSLLLTTVSEPAKIIPVE